MYKRILLKLSGELLAGDDTKGIDTEKINWIANELKKAHDIEVEIAIVFGGGNIIRGATFAVNGVDETTAHYMGMMGTIINGMTMADVLEKSGLETRLMTRMQVENVVEPYNQRHALRYIEDGKIMIICGGLGRPYMTTDSASVINALELKCDAVFKATKVDGVYDKDPIKHKDATKYKTLSLAEAASDSNIRVLDRSAISMAADNNLPILVFKLEEDSIMNAVQGNSNGTLVQ